ncbi:NADP-dependent oxidoreductase [Fodinicola acaciae]|uniref:NADP-dependent oxidoreductase n=1 Tax=Fodinicola acaciae TaxID=2681555 RepID=UPI0013D09771|nr:NADP-dependent oxidoreductase [Fodinicola acaciae]
MRAISPKGWGEADVLQLIDTPRPEPIATEVLVRVRAASVNPTDWKSRRDGSGYWKDPVILGYDVSGVVKEAGAGVTLFRPGDEVFGMPWFPRQAGAYAEYVTAPARHFTRKPASLDHLHAAAIPLVGLTAWQALAETAGVRQGQRVLVHAAAGGVGHVAVQIAKSLGAYVIGTASAAKHDFVTRLGADQVIDYRSVDFSEVVKDVDVVLDTIGGDYYERSLKVVRPGGHLVSLTEAIEGDRLVGGVHVGFTLVEPDHAGMKQLARLVDSGRLRVEIDSVFPLEEAAAAHRRSESGRATGKIVLTI